MKRPYSLDEHAHRVMEMLDSLDQPCGDSVCPACAEFEIPNRTISAPSTFDRWWKIDKTFPCQICRKFSEITAGCPCLALGKEETIRRAWLKLEELGYLD